jgi:hypothetical protein
MKKIVITESQLKKLVTRRKLSENLDMEDMGMSVSVKMALFSHLSDIQHMVSNQDVIDRINFLKLMIRKYPDTNQEVTTNDLDAIYDQMLGMTNKEKKNPPIDKNPFPDGFDISMNESRSLVRESMMQAADIVNQKTGENLSPEDVEDIVCGVDPDAPVDVDLSSLPEDQRSEARQKIDQLVEKIKRASLQELIKLKAEFREFRRKYKKEQQNEQAGPSIVTALFGIPMSPVVGFLAIFACMGLVMFLIIRYLIPAISGDRAGSCGGSNRPRPNSNFRHLF